MNIGEEWCQRGAGLPGPTGPRGSAILPLIGSRERGACGEVCSARDWRERGGLRVGGDCAMVGSHGGDKAKVAFAARIHHGEAGAWN